MFRKLECHFVSETWSLLIIADQYFWPQDPKPAVERGKNVWLRRDRESQVIMPFMQLESKNWFLANLSLSNQLACIVLCNYSFQCFMNNRRQHLGIVFLTKGSVDSWQLRWHRACKDPKSYLNLLSKNVCHELNERIIKDKNQSFKKGLEKDQKQALH